ncbi:hypothetical protein ACWF5H_12760 [Arthrobacter sp. NPDC055138]
MSMTEQFVVPAKQDDLPRMNGFGLASLILGAFAVAVAFIPVLGLPALVLGPLAMIFGGIGRARVPRDTVAGTAGLILGTIGTVIALIITFLLAVNLVQLRETFPTLPLNSAQAPSVSPNAARSPAPASAPSPETTGQMPGKNCQGPGEAGLEGVAGGTPVTYVVDGEPGKTFNVDYGHPMEYGCVEGVSGHWEITRSMSDPEMGIGITTWYDGGGDETPTCKILIDGKVVDEGSLQGCTF